MKCPYAKKQEYICGECHNSIFYYTECRKSITEPMTNEEWFCSLPTEEKAEWLYYHSGAMSLKGDWEDWLKEKHDGE